MLSLSLTTYDNAQKFFDILELIEVVN